MGVASFRAPAVLCLTPGCPPGGGTGVSLSPSRPRPGLHRLPPGSGDVALLTPLGLLLLLHGRPPGTGQPGIKRDGHSEPERQWCAGAGGGEQWACSPTLNLMPRRPLKQLGAGRVSGGDAFPGTRGSFGGWIQPQPCRGRSGLSGGRQGCPRER